MEEPKITNVYVFGNGMVMAFDQHGQQMPEYQGPDTEVRAKIMAVYNGPIVGVEWNSVREAMKAADGRS